MICEANANRRRRFWATQYDAQCETTTKCGTECNLAGLVRLENDSGGATIATTDWVQGLAINMLMTAGRRPDSPCGYAAGSLGGHWSESFDTGAGAGIGSLVLSTGASASVNETLNLVTAYARATLERMVARGVALRVNVDGEYLGANRFQITADIIGLDNTSARVGVTGERLEQGWVWSE